MVSKSKSLKRIRLGKLSVKKIIVKCPKKEATNYAQCTSCRSFVLRTREMVICRTDVHLSALKPC